MNRFPKQSTGESDNNGETGDRNISRRDFLKVAFATAALVAGGATMGTLTGCSSNNANATSGGNTTTEQPEQPATTDNSNTSNNGGNSGQNSDSQAEVSKLKAAIGTSGFTLDSKDSEIPQAGGGYSADVEFTYNGKTYKGIVGTSNNTEYTVEFDSLNFEETGKSLDGAKDWIINNCINKSNS